MRLLSWLVVLLFLPLTLCAAQYPPSYRWRTITTEHFYTHYHQGEEELARRAAAIAEEAHVRLAPMLRWQPRNRTHLVLSDQLDVSNGFATTFPFNRIEIYVSAPGADPSTALEHYDDWLHLVITHEYAHILHLDQAREEPAVLRRILGRYPLTFPNQFAPSWMIEGLATVLESEATAGGRLKGTYLDMVLRTAAVEGRFASAGQAGGLTPDWPAGSARYLYGAAFLSWLARERGADKLPQYFNEYSGQMIPFLVNAPSREVYGESMTALWRTWSAEAQNEYRARHAALSAAGLTPKKRLTNLGYETKYPAVSPDGTRIAYAHRGAYEWPTLRVLDVATGKDIATRSVNSISPLAWSPDGTTVAFSQLEFRRYWLHSDLYLWDLRSGEVRQVTRGERLKSAAFTPDGRSLVAVQNRAGRNRIVSVDIATGAVRPIVEPGDFRQFSEPVVSRDGTRLAVAEWVSGRIDVVLYSMNGERIVNLTEAHPPSANASPRFTPDGRAIVFSSDVTGISNLYSMDVETRKITRITNLYGGAFFPSTADGRTIYYTDYSSEGFDIASIVAGDALPVVPRPLRRSVIGLDAARADTPVPPALTTVEDRPYSALRSVAPRWWFPVFGGTTDGEEDESTIGAYTAGSDALGFHSYEVQVTATSRDEGTRSDYSFVYAYDRLYPTLVLMSNLYSDPTPLSFFSGGVTTRYRERIHRTVAQATFPYTKYRWQTSATVGAIREDIRSDASFDIAPGTLESVGLFEGVLTGGRVAFAFNSAREFGYAISPENGVLAFLDLEKLGGARSVEQARGDVRGFLSIPIARAPLGRHVVAGRVAGGWTGGDFLVERELRLGGVGSEGLLSTGTTVFPVRGFNTGSVRGRNAALVSLEYRLPLYEVDRGPAVWPIFFHRIVGNVFYDTASAWNPEAVQLPALQRPKSDPFSETNTISSAGVELAADIFLGFFLPLRVRAGVAYALEAPPCPAAACEREGNVQFYTGVGRSF